jgi:hypothetical protein
MKNVYWSHKATYIIVVSTFIFLSCQGPKGADGLTGPSGADGTQGVAGPKLSGAIKGFVSLYKEDGSDLIDYSGVKVSLDGFPNDTTTTDKNGKWTLQNIQTGTYTITFNKIGYGIQKIIGYQFAGGGDAFIPNTIVSEKSTNRVASLSVSSSSGTLNISGTLSSSAYSNNAVLVLIYFDTLNTVSSDPAHYKYLNIAAVFSGQTAINTLQIAVQSLYDVGFLKGARVYIAGYTNSVMGFSYKDTLTGREVYTALCDSSKVSSFILP